MGKENLLEFMGTVTDCLPNARFAVAITMNDQKHTLTAYASGRIRENRIRIICGDQVKIELDPRDPSQGRITFREKTGSPPPFTGQKKRPGPRR